MTEFEDIGVGLGEHESWEERNGRPDIRRFGIVTSILSARLPAPG